MRLRHPVICLQLLLTLQLVFAPGLHAQVRWRKFISPDRDFTINFPGVPERKPATGDNTRVQPEQISLTIANHYMEVQYVDLRLPPKTREQLAASLEGVRSGYLKALERSGGRLLELQELREGGYQFDITGRLRDNTPVYSRTRIYVLGKRQYTISCVTWNETGLEETLANRFLDSFHHISPSPSNLRGKNFK